MFENWSAKWLGRRQNNRIKWVISWVIKIRGWTYSQTWRSPPPDSAAPNWEIARD